MPNHTPKYIKMSFSSLRIELPTRPRNATMGVLFNLITLIFGDPEKELRWEDGGLVLFFEVFYDKQDKAADRMVSFNN